MTDARIEIQVSCRGYRRESRGARRNLVVSLAKSENRRFHLEGRCSRETSSRLFAQTSARHHPSACLGIVLLSSQSYKTSRWTGPPPSSSTLPGGVHLRQRLAIEALPPDALRRLPPVPIVAAADGAVVHLHIDSGWDDRRSGEAIWTCRMGGGWGEGRQ